MRISCCAYSYRQALQAGTLSLFDFIQLCREIGFDGVELTSYYFATTERSYLNEVKRFCHKEGVLISGTAVGNNFANTDATERRKHVDMTKSWIDHSVVLGAPTIRVFAGHLNKETVREEAFQNVAEALKECAEYAWERGILLALENHDGLTATGADVLRLYHAVDHKGLGINADMGNFVGNIYPEIEIVAPYSVATHAKVTARGAETGTHFPVDYKTVRTILDNANYRGWIAVEYEDQEPADEAVPRFFTELQSAFA